MRLTGIIGGVGGSVLLSPIMAGNLIKPVDCNAMFDMLFEVEGGTDDVVEPEPEFDESKLDALENE